MQQRDATLIPQSTEIRCLSFRRQLPVRRTLYASEPTLCFYGDYLAFTMISHYILKIKGFYKICRNIIGIAKTADGKILETKRGQSAGSATGEKHPNTSSESPLDYSISENSEKSIGDAKKAIPHSLDKHGNLGYKGNALYTASDSFVLGVGKNNREIDIIKESPNTESAYSENLATDTGAELSNEII